MITYKLAEKLKDTGFPQRDWGDVYSCESGHELMMIPQKLRATGNIDVGPTISCPTLSELIEACGEIPLSIQNVHWCAGPEMDKKRWRSETKTKGNYIENYGSSPEEAVANLWLSINKK